MSCPDDNAINGWLEGALAPAELSAIASHVGTCQRCQALLAELDPHRTERSPRPEPGRVPSRIGRFEVLRQLGEGGMGLTFVARDPQLHREVCVKVLKPLEGSDARAEHERLMSEARAQAALSHPAIVPVYEIASDEQMVALVMELVQDGQSLRRWLKTARPVEEVLAVMIQAGEGLVAAHAAGIVHRDFKPENIMIAAGRPRLIDFGLARHVVELEPGPGPPMPERVVTRTVAAGTPAYMAPELFRSAPGDARADQYSFCVTLYEALVGRRPFARAHIAEQLRAQLTESPPLTERISPGVWSVLQRGLSPAPELRFPSMAALLAALLPQAPRAGAGRAPRRRAVAAAAAVVVLSAGAVGLVQLMRAPEPGSAERAGPHGSVAAGAPPAAPTAASSRVDGVADARAEATRAESVDAGVGPARATKAADSSRTGARVEGVRPGRGPAKPAIARARPLEVGPPEEKPEATFPVRLEVTPAVSVRWRGQVIGSAPGQVELPAGRQEVTLVSAERRARRTVVVTVAPDMKPVEVALGEGTLELRVSPWAYVSVDGKPLGSTPVAAQPLWEGPHEVVIERPDLGYRNVQTVVIASGAHEVLRHVVDAK